MFTVGGRMFALVPLEVSPAGVTVKCDPEPALELRARHPSVRPGHHLNKRHWSTVELDGSVADDELRWMTKHSYELVVADLPPSVRGRFHSI